MATEFSSPFVSTLKVKVYLDSDSTITNINNLVSPCESKCITVTNVRKDISVAEADTLLRMLLGENNYDLATLEKLTTYDANFDMEFFVEDLTPIFNGSYELSGRNFFTHEDINPILEGTYQLSGRNTFTADDLNHIFD